MSWSDAETKVGHLPPFEACKALAFHKALETIFENLGKDLRERCRAVIGKGGERLSK